MKKMEILSDIQVEPILQESDPDLSNLSFGENFTSHMFSQSYSSEKGWYNAKIGSFESFDLPPSTTVFHYGQEIFDGTKAFRSRDGGVNLFRPWENAKRFNRSAVRMAMPEVDTDFHVNAIAQLVQLDQKWVPNERGSALYIRPTMIATDPRLGIYASKSYLHFIILSPVGAYFSQGFNPVPVYIERDYVRAVKGGTGNIKTGANYASSLMVGAQAKEKGYQQVLWLDAFEHKYVEEVGAMNIGFVYNGKHICTPELSGTILPGITRDSILKLAPDLGYTVSEEKLDINNILADIKKSEITEVFGIGTAAVIAPIGILGDSDQQYIVNNNETGPVAKHLFKSMTDIQYGWENDPYNWIMNLATAD